MRRRRIHGITVVGALDEASRAIPGARADEVLVTIPDAPRSGSQLVVQACRGGRGTLPHRERRTEFTAPETAEAVVP